MPTSITFRAVLTGAQDSQADATIPLSAFYASLYSGVESNFQVGVPYSAETAEILAARPNGDIQVYKMADGVESLAFELNVEARPLARGAYSATYTIRGTKQTTNSTPATIAVDRIVSEGSDSSGVRTWQVPAYLNIRPGDSATIGAETVPIDRVQYQASPVEGLTMTIREAAP